MLIGILANLALGGVGLGVPYARGRWRATDSEARFATFAACLYGGAAEPDPGLALPPGARARFATQVLTGPPDWPLSCRPALRAIAPEEAIFVFPGVKRAEIDLRETTATLDSALRELAGRRAQARRARGELQAVRVPEAPLAGVGRLQAALVEQLRASDLEVDVERLAVTFAAERQDLPTPSRFPLGVRGEQPDAGSPDDAERYGWRVTGDAAAFTAVGLDARTVAWSAYADGVLHPHQAHRPGLASGTLRTPDDVLVLFSTPEERCPEEEDRCARHATGLSRFVRDRQRLAPERWVGVHPAGRPAASFRAAPDALYAVARRRARVTLARLPAVGDVLGRRGDGEDGGEDAASSPTARDRARPLGPDLERPVLDTDAPVEVAWVADGAAGAHVVVAGEDAAAALSLDGAGEPRPVPRPSGDVRLAACGGWVALAGPRGAVVVDLRGGDEGAAAGAKPPGAYRPDLDLDPPRASGLALTCGDGFVDVYTLERAVLRRVRCGARGCGDPLEVARSVVRFSAVALAEAESLVAITSDPVDAPVRLVRITSEGLEPPTTPAACWAPTAGLCGAPSLTGAADRMLLAVLEGTDLRLLESRDGGRSWGPLRRR